MGKKKSKLSFPDARRSVAEAPAARSSQSEREAEKGPVRCEKVSGLTAGAQQQQSSLPVSAPRLELPKKNGCDDSAVSSSPVAAELTVGHKGARTIQGKRSPVAAQLTRCKHSRQVAL